MGQTDTALRRLVDERYPSVVAFSEAAGLGRTTVYRLFKGELATVDTAEKAARALSIDYYTLLDLVRQADAHARTRRLLSV